MYTLQLSILNIFTLLEAQFRNKSYDEDDEKKRHIEDEICYDNSRSLRHIHLFYDTTKFDKVQTFRTQFLGSIISVKDDHKILKYIRNMK